MKITYITFGKFKSLHCAELFDYYIKLSQKFIKVEHLQLNSQKTNQNLSLLSWLEKNKSSKILTLLDEKGQMYKSSRAFAEEIQKNLSSSKQEWIIALGSEHGFSADLKKHAQSLWSLSALTLPHELAGVVAAEQIFRGLSILKNHPYHND